MSKKRVDVPAWAAISITLIVILISAGIAWGTAGGVVGTRLSTHDNEIRLLREDVKEIRRQLDKLLGSLGI